MKKLRTQTFVLALLISSLAPVFPAAAHAQALKPTEICPVTGDKIDPKVSTTYKGKEYHFCCRDCVRKFKRNPEKYIARMEKEKG